MKLNGWYFDCEADGLYLQSKNIWYINLKAIDGSRSLSIRPFEDGKENLMLHLCNGLTHFLMALMLYFITV